MSDTSPPTASSGDEKPKRVAKPVAKAAKSVPPAKKPSKASKSSPPLAKVLPPRPSKPESKPDAPKTKPKSSAQLPVTAEDDEAQDRLSVVEFFTTMAPAWLLSLMLHILVVLGLAFYTLASLPEKKPKLDLVASVSDVEEMHETPDMELEVMELDELVEEVVEEPISEMVTELTLDSSAMAGDINDVIAPDSLTSLTSDMGLMTTEVGGQVGENLGTGMENNGAKSVFFSKSGGKKRVVFVVDNSNSMGQGKLETALVELNKAVQGMSSDQFFYIVFYSDTAYGLFHPQTAPTLVQATKDNKYKVQAWLPTVQMCLRTNGKEAMQAALNMKPQVLYLLGDGAFGDKTGKALISNPIPGLIIHTLGMKMKPEDARDFELIAKLHRGTYRDVGVTEEGAAMLKRMGPRPKNNVPAPPWGLKLGDRKKKK